MNNNSSAHLWALTFAVVIVAVCVQMFSGTGSLPGRFDDGMISPDPPDGGNDTKGNNDERDS